MFRELAELFQLIYVIVLKGGWMVLAWALIYMFYKLYIDDIQIKWYRQQKWVFLKITAPKVNEKSPIAFEQILNQLHSVHSTFTWAEKYLEGQFQIWFTWEIASIGGTIGNYVRILEKHRDTLEAAIFSQFPGAEITEAEDYFQSLPKYVPETSEFDTFSFSFILAKKEDAYPIRTYYDFEHSATDTFIDPVEGMWEELGKLNPYEMFVTQFILRPIDDSWKKVGYELVKKLKGEPEALKGRHNVIGGFIGKIAGPILDIIIRATPSESRKQDPPPSLMLHLSEGEKNVISAIENNLRKLGYQTKIRCMYIAPREKYNPSPVYTAIIGAFKSLKATDINGLKPDTDRWTKIKIQAWPWFENKFSDLRLNFRKRRFMYMIRNRWYFWGPKTYVLNTEELATVLHFQRSTVVVPPIDTVTVTKVQPPPELPIVL